MHKSNKTIKAFQKAHVEPVWLPKNSPKLNCMEDKFSDLQREVIDNSNFKSKEEMINAIEAYAAYYNNEKEAKRKYISLTKSI